MKNLYQLITSSNYIESSLVMLPNMNTQVCYSGQVSSAFCFVFYVNLCTISQYILSQLQNLEINISCGINVFVVLQKQ